MASSAHHVRTSLALCAAGTTVIAALLLHPRNATPIATTEYADDGMTLTARLTSSRILGGAHDQNLAVTITAPAARTQLRPPLSLAVVIDRSGSMDGEPMENAKAAAARLVSQLDPNDAFSIVTYSSSDETVMPMGRATASNKAAALDAIARIYDDGGTCISCGLRRGANELAMSPIEGGVQRMVVISDGQANEGIWDRNELAQLAANTAAGGVSISTVGVGLDFDEVTMVRLAEVGRGNYYFVEDTRQLDAMFARELGGLAKTIAADVKLLVTDGAGARIEEAYGYPITRTGDHVVIPIADLRAGETRKIVLRVHVVATNRGPLTVSTVQLGWRRVSDGANRRANAAAQVEVVDDQAAVAASVDFQTVESVEQALSSRALEEASFAYEQQGAAAAQQVLQRRVKAVRANQNLPMAAKRRIESATTEADQGFAAAPSGGAAGDRAKKTSRKAAYDLAR